MTAPTNQAYQRLRAWAAGDLALEAATELMITASYGRFVQAEWPWMHPTVHGQWIDFSTIPVQIGALSGGEQRFLQIAAALDDGETTVNLGRCLAGLDRQHVHLVLAAVAHAAGTHQHQQLTFRPDGGLTVDRPGSMYRWDQPATPAAAPSRGGVGR